MTMDELEKLIKGNIKGDFTRQSDQFYFNFKGRTLTIRIINDPLKNVANNYFHLMVRTELGEETTTGFYVFESFGRLEEFVNQLLSVMDLKDTQTKLF